MRIYDTVVLEDGALRQTHDGYLVGTPRVARAGNIQVYLGREVGRPEVSTVRVYRPREEVFADAALHSAAYRPVTVEHPKDGVSVRNWKSVAAGTSGGEVLKDGDFIRVPLALMDSAAVEAFNNGKKELSAGYDCELDFTPGKLEDGTQYDAVQRNIRFNHFALVGQARGGPELKLGDSPQEQEMTEKTRTVVVDGVSFTMNDQGAEVVTKLQKAVADAQTLATSTQAQLADANTKLADALAAVEKLKVEKTTLEAKVADATKPETLAAAAAAHKLLRDTAAKLAPSVKLDGLGDAAIRKAVVDLKLGDKAAGFDESKYATAFDVLATDVKVADAASFRSDLGAPRERVADSEAVSLRDANWAKRQERNKNAYKNAEQ